jgi:isopropylmalate/homocitrate/citramalate synthase
VIRDLPGGEHATAASVVSALNAPLAADSPMYRRPPLISDCTLRDGEQQAGVVFRREDKVALARLMADIGIRDLEVCTPAVSEEDRLALEEISGLGLDANISALARATKSDIDLVAACGAWGVRISLPISKRQRAAKIDLGDDAYLKLALETSTYARGIGLAVVFSPYDTARGEVPFLVRVLRALAKEGCVERVRLVDTVGGATPETIAYLVRVMTEATEGIPIEVHCHNDFGLGTANTVAGALAGASYLSTTVNGLGERSGNTSLEEVVMTLKVLYGVELPIDTARFSELSADVARRSGIGLQPHKAVVGSNCFAHETGMVVAGVANDPFTAEPYAPSLVGQVRSIVVGKKSGKGSIELKLKQLGIEPLNELVGPLLALTKDEATRLGRGLRDEEFLILVDRCRARA